MASLQQLVHHIRNRTRMKKVCFVHQILIPNMGYSVRSYYVGSMNGIATCFTTFSWICYPLSTLAARLHHPLVVYWFNRAGQKCIVLLEHSYPQSSQTMEIWLFGYVRTCL